MKQTSSLTRKLTDAQVAHAESKVAANQAILYTLYTEDRPNLPELVSRYFAGATIVKATGLWLGQVEQGAVIYIIASLDTVQSVFHLAGDIKVRNNQQSVLVTWSTINRFDVQS